MKPETIQLILNIYIGFLIISISFSILLMICGPSLFKKANKNKYEALIPIYNLYVLLQILQIPAFNFIVFLFPLFNVILIIYIEYKLHKTFYTSKLFFVGLLFFPFIFMLILAFGKYRYKQKILTKEEEENNEVDTSPLLMSEEELKSINEIKAEDNLDVDSIFKSEIEMLEEVAPYRASKVNSEDEIYESEEEIKNEVSEEKKIEKVEVVDLADIKKDKEEEKVEIVDL
jgi:hypothetical protein